MWPWEHLAVAYLAYSLGRRLRKRAPPGHFEALALAFGSQFPDLVDKPLAWTFHVLPSGLSLAHSLLVAVPTTVAVFVLAGLRDLRRRSVAVAFGTGYVLHLPADGLYPIVYGSAPRWQFLLWPLIPASGATQAGFLENVVYYLGNYLHVLATPKGLVFVVAELLLLGTALGMWLRDGRPGVRPFVDVVCGRQTQDRHSH